ncbi:uncharacterized protein [Haliotis cracherodii]|uniref:uncharacterized protein n=1 Tax=Haliotis cracherodii TaxID=6455 RepID=UPI0039E84D3B
MSRGSGRLGLIGALHRQSMFDDRPTGSDTASASQARLERDLKEAKDDNVLLRAQLEEARSALDMLVKQSSHESFDERRVNLLKCQLIQQERQILLLNEAVGSRAATLMEVENALSWLADSFRSHIAAEVRGTNVPVPRSDLVKMVETAESARIKLFKNIQNSSQEHLSKPLLLMNDFLHPGLQEDHTLLDVVSGKLEHLNLKRVSQLEAKLSSLYKELVRMHHLISDDKWTSERLCSSHMTSAVKERLNTQVLRSCAMMKDCADDLLTLSLLVPSAPWPVLKRPVLKEVSADEFLSCLPSLPRGKAQAVHRLVNTLLRVCNYRHHIQDREVKALREEVKFHQSVYDLQLEYTHSLLDAVREGYREFETSASEVIVKPLTAVLEGYALLKTTTDEDALRTFLSLFKENEELFSDAVGKLSLDTKSSRDEKNASLTAFGEDFMTMLDQHVLTQQRKRERGVRERQDLKVEQEKLDEELRTLLKDIEYEKENVKDISHTNNSNCQTRTGDESVRASPKPSSNIGLQKSKSDLNIEKHDSSPEKDDSFENEKTEAVDEREGMSSRTPQSRLGRGARKPPLKHNTDSTPSPHRPSYKPQLYVPNRTLKLRRSGSLTRISNDTSSPHARPTEVAGRGEQEREDTRVCRDEGQDRRHSDLPKLSRLPQRKAPFK